jgi:hypothetical protein
VNGAGVALLLWRASPAAMDASFIEKIIAGWPKDIQYIIAALVI